MATRSRTTLFLQYRQSFTRTTRRKPALNISNVLAGGPGFAGTDERAGLLGAAAETRNGYTALVDGAGAETVLEMGPLAPRWAEIVQEVETALGKMREKLAQLEQLHKRHLLPGFEDKYSDERQIEVLADEVTRLLLGTQRKIKNIEARIAQTGAPAAPGPDGQPELPALTPSQQKMARNVQLSLAQKLQELGAQFRKQQSNYLQKLRGRAARTAGLLASSDDPDADTANAAALEDYDIDTGFTSEQTQVVASNERAIAERERAIDSIAKSIAQIAVVFQELQTMVIDQGTILDRIDYNMEMVVGSLKDGVVELKKGEEYQKASRAKTIIFILLMLVFVAVILLIYRRTRSSTSTST